MDEEVRGYEEGACVSPEGEDVRFSVSLFARNTRHNEGIETACHDSARNN